MFSKLYLLSGLLAHAGMLGLLLRYLEKGGVTVREAIVGILTQGSVMLEEAGVIAEDAGLVQTSYLPAPSLEEEELDISLELDEPLAPFDDILL